MATMSDDALAMAQADRERLEAENDELAAYSARLREALGRAAYRRCYDSGDYRGCSVCERAVYDVPAEPHADNCIVGRALAEPTPALVERFMAAERVADLLTNFWRAKTSEQPLVEALSAWRALRGEEAQA